MRERKPQKRPELRKIIALQRAKQFQILVDKQYSADEIFRKSYKDFLARENLFESHNYPELETHRKAESDEALVSRSAKALKGFIDSRTAIANYAMKYSASSRSAKQNYEVIFALGAPGMMKSHDEAEILAKKILLFRAQKGFGRKPKKRGRKKR